MPPCAPAPVCRHLRTDGTPCGSPALRGKPVCFYHDAARQPLTLTRDLGRVLPSLPAPDDLHAIQIGYSQLLRLIATDEIAPRTATLLLRTLAQASQNLARIHRRERTHPATPVADLILDPAFGPLAPAPAMTEQNQYFTGLEENPAPTQPGTGAPRPASETWASPHAPSAPAAETQPPAPTPTLRPAPELPEAPAQGPFTLNEQYILADRDHRLSPAGHHAAITAIATRIRNSTPEDRQRDHDILAARTHKEEACNQYFTENNENPTHTKHPTFAQAA